MHRSRWLFSYIVATVVIWTGKRNESNNIFSYSTSLISIHSLRTYCHLKYQTLFHQDSRTCVCALGYLGPDCSQSSQVTSYTVFTGALLSPSPAPRYGHTVVSCGSQGLILYAGFSSSTGFLSDVWSFSGGTWSEIDYSGT